MKKVLIILLCTAVAFARKDPESGSGSGEAEVGREGKIDDVSGGDLIDTADDDDDDDEISREVFGGNNDPKGGKKSKRVKGGRSKGRGKNGGKAGKGGKGSKAGIAAAPVGSNEAEVGNDGILIFTLNKDGVEGITTKKGKKGDADASASATLLSALAPRPPQLNVSGAGFAAGLACMLVVMVAVIITLKASRRKETKLDDYSLPIRGVEVNEATHLFTGYIIPSDV
eukprot:gene17997-11328_t